MSLPPFSSLPSMGSLFCLSINSMASKGHRSIMGPEALGPSALWVILRTLVLFSLGVRPPVGVKKWFEALIGKFLPFVVSYISHFICSYNLNYNFEPLRGPSIILIFTKVPAL